MTDLNPHVQQQAQAAIQEIVEGLSQTHRGEDPDAVHAALTRAMADAGIPEQPEKWMKDTADEIASGRTLVVDRARRDEDDPAR